MLTARTGPAPLPQPDAAGLSSEHVCSLRTTDPCQHADSLPQWSQEYVQLSGGAFLGQIQELSTGPVQLFRETMNQIVDERAQARPRSYVIGIPSSVEDGGFWQGYELSTDSLLALSPGEELYFRTPRSSDIFVCVIDDQAMEEYAEVVHAQAAPALVRKAQMRRLDPQMALRYREVLGMVLADVIDTPEILHHAASRRTLTDALIEAALDAASSLADHTERLHPRQSVQRAVVERARAYILAHPDTPPTVAELCSHLKMSRRGLHHAFMNVLGISPIAFLRYVRLHRVRKDLLADGPETTVSDAACKWGFTHMGMFATYYKSLFGESPSVTLKTSRRVFGQYWTPERQSAAPVGRMFS